MSAELEAVAKACFSNLIPDMWLKKCAPARLLRTAPALLVCDASPGRWR
jgi:hypothetical protein